MTLSFYAVTFDAGDPHALARFWGVVFETDDIDLPNPFVAFVRPPSGPNLTFLKVPEPKVAKNRCHLDLHADSQDAVDAHVDRLQAAGASVVGHHEEFGVYWTTVRDPEGNELCIGTPVELPVTA